MNYPRATFKFTFTIHHAIIPLILGIGARISNCFNSHYIHSWMTMFGISEQSNQKLYPHMYQRFIVFSHWYLKLYRCYSHSESFEVNPNKLSAISIQCKSPIRIMRHCYRPPLLALCWIVWPQRLRLLAGGQHISQPHSSVVIVQCEFASLSQTPCR